MPSADLERIAEELNGMLRAESERRQRFRESLQPEDKAEFINGVAVFHSPATLRHTIGRQNLTVILRSWIIPRRLGTVLDEKALCAFQRNDYEPDIACFSAEQSAQFSPDQRLFPVPALIVEVLSPSTEANDRGVKFDDYARSGVREYWLVDPRAETVEIHAGANGAFERVESGETGRLRSRFLEGLGVDLRAAFNPESALREAARFSL
ncbi:MAG: Uma2 family endonuclease [Verrucomicrobia bacterium]|nr:Uma2 family endonuclease [Verrucomicrobiota bacterium]